MAADSILEDEEENILYDLLINAEWPPETDTQVRTVSAFNHCRLLTDNRLVVDYFFLTPNCQSHVVQVSRFRVKLLPAPYLSALRGVYI